MRIGGKKDVEGAFVVSGPAVVAEQLPALHPQGPGLDYVQKYEKIYGPARATSLRPTAMTSVCCWRRSSPSP